MKIFVAIWRLFSVKNTGSFTSHTERERERERERVRERVRSVKAGKCYETGHTVFRPHPRRLGCLTINRCETKAAHSTQLFLDPEC